LLAAALICVGAFAAIYRFWRPGISGPADMLIGVYRVFELEHSWQNGVIFPRLAMGLNYGYGGPLFEYYPPLVSYVALAFRWFGLDWIASAKAGFTLAVLVAGLGSYVYARWLFQDRKAGLLASAAYMFAPYILLDVYERGASAELMALALLPWVFWAAQHLLDLHDAGAFVPAGTTDADVLVPGRLDPPRLARSGSPGNRWVLATAVLVALLMLAHNITALFVIPVLVAYLVLLTWQQHSWSRLPVVGIAVALGLGLSAFYWLPALAEGSYSKLTTRMLGDVSAQLVPLDHLIQNQWAFDYFGSMRFRMSLPGAVLGIIAVLTIISRARRLRFILALFAVIGVVLLFLVTDLSRPFWQNLPLVRFIQFPWRLLGIATFCVALLIGSLAASSSVARWRLPGWAGWTITVLLVGLLAYCGLQNADPSKSSFWYPITSDQMSKADLYERGRDQFPLYGDYTPASMQLGYPETLSLQRLPQVPPSEPLAAPPQVQVLAEADNEIQVEVHAPLPFTMHWPRIYFPRWQAYVDGLAVPTTPEGPFGLASTPLPEGDHIVVLRFEDTPLRVVSNAIAFLCLVLLTIGGLRTLRGRRVVLLCVLLFLTLAGGAIAHKAVGPRTREPANFTANLQNEISLAGYQFENAKLHKGEPLVLRLYWFAHKTPAYNYKVFVHIEKPDGSAMIANGDDEPMHGYAPTSRWDAGELVVDEHTVKLDPGLASGAYRVVVGIYRPETMQNLVVKQATKVLPGDLLPLGQIEVLER